MSSLKERVLNKWVVVMNWDWSSNGLPMYAVCQYSDTKKLTYDYTVASIHNSENDAREKMLWHYNNCELH